MTNFRNILDGSVKRGCVKDLREEEIEICRNSTWCTICEEDDCNNEKIGSNTSQILGFGSLILVSMLIAIQM